MGQSNNKNVNPQTVLSSLQSLRFQVSSFRPQVNGQWSMLRHLLFVAFGSLLVFPRQPVNPSTRQLINSLTR